jgi:hypothetical protein
VQCSVQDGEGGLLDYDLTVMSSTRSRCETVPVTKIENITGKMVGDCEPGGRGRRGGRGGRGEWGEGGSGGDGRIRRDSTGNWL